MHPLISLISFILFSAFVSLGNADVLFAGFLLLLFVWIISKQKPSKKAWMMIKRLKIFFISIFIIYLWFTPGQLVFPALDNWSPTYEGMIFGLERVLALCLLVIAVETLLRLMNRSTILCGLYYLATPFTLLGFSREKFIVRMMLTLESVIDFGSGKKKTNQPKKDFGDYIESVSERLVMRMEMALLEDVEHEPMTFNLTPLPAWYQWLVPVAIAALFISIV